MSGLKLKYFVLKPQSKTYNDPYACASRNALRAYAESISPINHSLSQDLLIWIDSEMARVPEKPKN